MPITVYSFNWITGREVRSGEIDLIKRWIGGVKDGDRLRLNHMHAFEHLLSARGTDLALRFQKTNGDPVLVLNWDHFAGPFNGIFVTRRLRKLLDLTARRMGVEIFPVPLTPFNRINFSRNGTNNIKYDLVERRGRECVFTRTTDPEGKVYFLSGFDRNEFPALYFLTQLPCEVSSIADAREALKPPSVVMAEAANRKVYRQGDMFAIVTKMTDADLIAAGAEFAIGYGAPLYGTAHTADLVATLPDGTHFARGRLHHDPSIIGENRAKDHRRRPLKTGRWHLVVKNTTPMRPPRPPPVVLDRKISDGKYFYEVRTPSNAVIYDQIATYGETARFTTREIAGIFGIPSDLIYTREEVKDNGNE